MSSTPATTGNASVGHTSPQQHKVPVNATFETGLEDAEILCDDVKTIIKARLMQLLAKFETKEILELIIALHHPAADEEWRVLNTKGLDARVTKAFKWASIEYGFDDSPEGVQKFRVQMFNPAARANGRSESRDHAAERAEELAIANSAELLLGIFDSVATDDEDAGSEQ